MSAKIGVNDWLQEVEDESTLWMTFITGTGHNDDDSFGWGEQICCYVEDKARSSLPSGGILLTGSQGCGKHTAAAYAAQSLESRGYWCVCLDGQEFPWGSFAECKAALMALFDEAFDRKQGLCLQLENTEECGYQKQFLTYLGKELRNYELKAAEYFPFFLLLIEENEQSIPSLLRNRLQLFRMTPPNYEQRRTLYRYKGMKLWGYISLEEFAKETEGLTYAQLLDLINSMENYTVLHKSTGIDKEQIFLLMESQQPTESPTDTSERLAAALEKLCELLPTTLAQTAVQPVSIVSAAAEKTDKEETAQLPFAYNDISAQDAHRAALQDKPTAELCIMAFGEEKYRKWLQKYEEQVAEDAEIEN